MAKFNRNKCNEQSLDKSEKELFGCMLASCLSDEEYEKLNHDWQNIGGYKVVYWWKFALDNINVSYKK